MKKTKVMISAILTFVITISSVSCLNRDNKVRVENKYTIAPSPISYDSNTKDIRKVSEANNKVAFKFLNEAITNHKKDNVIISPLSLNTILSLTQNGAMGNTKEEILKVLEMLGCEDKMINESYKNIIAHYNSLDNIQIKMSDSIWIQEKFKVEKEFMDIGSNYYEAETKEVNFSKKKATDTINNWVASHTAGKIDKIVDSFDPGTVMALINTIYSKGKWQKPFKESLTSKQKFTSTDGTYKNVDMMSGNLSANHFKGNNFEAVRIPYENNDLGMYVFLPNKESNTELLLKELTLENWTNWEKEFRETTVEVKLPKFKVEYEEKLNDMLKGFGMKEAFEPIANFSKIDNTGGLHIDFVKQKCYINIDENGSEAAAATAIGMRKSAEVISDKVIKFTADRPFIYAIADKKTDLIIFMGKVEKL